LSKQGASSFSFNCVLFFGYRVSRLVDELLLNRILVLRFLFVINDPKHTFMLGIEILLLIDSILSDMAFLLEDSLT